MPSRSNRHFNFWHSGTLALGINAGNIEQWWMQRFWWMSCYILIKRRGAGHVDTDPFPVLVVCMKAQCTSFIFAAITAVNNSQGRIQDFRLGEHYKLQACPSLAFPNSISSIHCPFLSSSSLHFFFHSLPSNTFPLSALLPLLFPPLLPLPSLGISPI